jgi:nicotinate-nucleotide--dimethylbenzimidazole phosphoribosyltransferase
MTKHWYQNKTKTINSAAIEDALARQTALTKPAGSLGRLEEIGVKFSGWQGTEKPSLDKIQIAVFAADHGIAEAGVSAFPQQVTVEMVKNFARGGAAISVLARQCGAQFCIVNMGTAFPCGESAGLISKPVAAGTHNFAKRAAMSAAQLDEALLSGAETVLADSQVFIGGEMGIANTTSAAALGCAYLGVSACQLTGSGTGIDEAVLRHKIELIDSALALHKEAATTAFEKLCCFGGFEIAALAGAYIACAQKGVPVLVDGFISTAAAVAAVSLNSGVRDWMLFSHLSQESGHRHLLRFLDASPLLDFQMRLGEGSGAALCVCLLQSACLLQSEMATFEEAAVRTS